MKTKHILFLIFAGFLFPLLSIAQTTAYRSYFGNEFTHWYVYKSALDAVARSEMYSVNNEDTLLQNGVRYKKVYEYPSLENLNQWKPFYCFGLREEIETGSLFINSEDSPEMLVSSMDLQIGDKYYFPPSKSGFNQHGMFNSNFINVQEDENGYYTTVDSVYYKDDRKYIQFDAIYDGIDFDFPLTFIEGIGPNVSFISIYEPFSMAVCCNCYETESGLWKTDLKSDYVDFSQIENCFREYVSLPKIAVDSPLKLIQRKDEIELQPDAGSFESGKVYVYSTQGKLLFSQPVKGNTNIIIPTSGFSTGAYIIQLTEGKTKKTWSGKVML